LKGDFKFNPSSNYDILYRVRDTIGSAGDGATCVGARKVALGRHDTLTSSNTQVRPSRCPQVAATASSCSTKQ